MRFKTSCVQSDENSEAANARAAVRKIRGDLAGLSPTLVIFWAATRYDPDILAREMDDAFPGAVTMGCTTAGEGCGDKVLHNSVTAMAFSGEALAYCETALVLNGAKENAPSGRVDIFTDASAAMRHLGRGLSDSLMKLSYRDYVGFMLGDRMSSFTDSVLEKVGEMTNVLFVGGMAGDDQKFVDGQRVFYRGAAYARDAAVLALWKPAKGFELLKTQAVELTGPSLLITRADEEKRIIWEFDGEDAAQVYARAIGVDVESMNILDFDQHPLALAVDGEPYVHALMKKVDGRGLQMYAQVREGTRLTVTRAGDVCAVTADALAAKQAEMDTIEAILHINCVSRHTALQKSGTVDQFGELFGAIPNIAFSSYGEIHVGTVTLTSTMILFR